MVGFGLLGVGLWRMTTLPDDAGGGRAAVRAVGVSWLTISAAGAVPFVLTGVLTWDLALFESVSGLTGTGATVLAPIEGNTHGLLFYRQMTQWVGGMGVVVLAVAILPFLGIGGLELFRAESPGPTAVAAWETASYRSRPSTRSTAVLSAVSAQ